MVSNYSAGSGIDDMLCTSLAKTKADNRSAMRAILSTIRFLGCQGLPLRGTFCNNNVERGSESNSNFLQILHFRTNDIPQFKEWLKKAQDKFTSPSIQNKLLEIMAFDILRKINRGIFFYYG